MSLKCWWDFSSDVKLQEITFPNYRKIRRVRKKTGESDLIMTILSFIGECFTVSMEFFWVSVQSAFIIMFATLQLVFPKRGKSVKGKVVLITGASRGLGRQLALEFSRHGSRIVCVDSDVDGNNETLRLLDDGRSRAYTCDLTDFEAVDQLSRDVIKDLGHVDILVNSASILQSASVGEGKWQHVKEIIDVNLMSHLWTIRAFLPHMLQRDQGHIVGVSSYAGLTSLSAAAAYSASKHGVVGLMQSLREELRQQKKTCIKLTVACPYFMKGADLEEFSLDSRMPAIPVDYAARAIVRGVRRNYDIFTIYSFLQYLIAVANLFPRKVEQMVRDMLYARIKPIQTGAETKTNGVLTNGEAKLNGDCETHVKSS